MSEDAGKILYRFGEERVSGIREGDEVTHWTHPNEVGKVVRAQWVRTGGTVLHVLWPAHEYSVPYLSSGTLKKHVEDL